MTFYWWSHWFWITLLSNIILPNAVSVHSYPSQETTLEYNSNQQESSKKLVTRLYQTSTITWTTDRPTSNVKSTTLEKLKLEAHKNPINKTPIKDEFQPAPNDHDHDEEEEYYYDYEVKEDKKQKFNLEEMEADLERKEEASSPTDEEQHEVDVKRSAEDVHIKNSTHLKDEIKLSETSTTLRSIEANNYTNFTDKHNLTSTNTAATTATLNEATANATSTTNSSDNSIATNATTQTSTSNLTTQMPQVPATPKIVKAQIGNLDWLNTIAAQLSPSPVTTDVTQDDNGEPHKIPSTLQNVNKPEDLRRVESEHRTRKSKGLSAEYKVNRHINYSSDSKRSAATPVNEYDSEESSNVSSEALSVQHAYFMDVGAISAICFTVFGICCTVGTVGIVLYRRRFLNKPQALSEPDSSVYIDDSTMRVSDNSDEMYSLDNDSFLNSLEAMTIQNYWTDTVKHTKL